MKQKIFRTMVLLAVVSILVTSVCLSVFSYRELRSAMEQEVQNQTVLLQTALEEKGSDFLPAIEGKGQTNRITLIDTDGTVVYDNRVDVTALSNHGDREEVQEAQEQGSGASLRLSDTMGEETYYYAVRLTNGEVLRVANTMDSVYAMFFSMLPWTVVLLLIVILLAMLFSRRATAKILEPLNHLDLEEPRENDVYEELSPLLLKIQHQKDEIEDRMTAERRRQKEFIAVTENMSEGLIVLNSDCHILAVNHSTMELLNVEGEEYIGRHLLEMNRNLIVEKVAMTALNGGATRETIAENGHFYEIHGNPVRQGGKVRGAVLLLIDATERQKTEKLRREFSANVSHELKTPLTAISGYAELMENGLVKDGDMQDFSHRIHEEAMHLLDLIEDIIKLSRLDEADSDYLWETRDLTVMATSVAERLSQVAKAKNITVTVTGPPCAVQVVPNLVDELMYNLIDNAIKYSEGGTEVKVAVHHEGSQATFSVSDQGIGIPEKYQKRVFERFFRVDKSHAKTIGGTGLGLAIVKHVVNYHNGSISLKSEAGQGTKITVVFPA